MQNKICEMNEAISNMKSKKIVKYVYVAKNPAFPAYIKIGITDNISSRKDTLSNTSVPEDFTFIALFECYDAKTTEKTLHDRFNAYRHFTETGRRTEFFSADKLAEVLSFARTSLVGVKEITPNLNKKRRERTTFVMLGIPEGTEIYYKNIKDENYTGIVTKNNKVKFPGFKHPMTVSDIAGKLEGGARNGYKFFYYKNKSLEELRPIK